ncbi:flagellar biosynthesis anti-sigma factor FlgM [Novosphingobium sp. JCM 18896]|uniref:flagellar biosynthesis anti-sigma factor FlgM n=1 Tax=Novosphingobium sp. JCM 18896 TaxID=2989731 RepID=UPI002221FFDD|nr:flagellar biosynthesis anti-sigma factor FlgM [Novosphingobium sp. JCM 18896]MCW1428825.1 flagellar biosynthesis anti-sigma factor FlgM [Novosphingobium sp. JCM 18896]
MPPIELGPTRPIGAVDVRIARQSAGLRETAETKSGTPSTVAASDVLDPGEAPVDTSRVEVIRKAIETGQYPVFPAKIADGIIAAGMLLTKGQ